MTTTSKPKAETARAGIVNLDDVAARRIEKGTRFGCDAKRLGAAAGASTLGCSWYQVDPGRTAFPHHFHCANEEAIFILSGKGEVRIGQRREPVRAGDYIAFPAGPDHAHSLTNTGDTPLSYLCLSTMVPTDVLGYPDSGKTAFVGGKSIMGGILSNPDIWVRSIVKDSPPVDYYDGEDTGE